MAITQNLIFIKKLIIITCFLIICFNQILYAQEDFILRWGYTDDLIRDNKIEKEAAIDSIKLYSGEAASFYKRFYDTLKYKFVYPLNGCSLVTYRKNGNDYIDEDFDYFQGGEFHGHPAHDIFILDNDSNGFEDSTLKKVTAVSVVNGFVISAYNKWQKGDFLRSGNYVKIFDPVNNGIYYYSHLDSVFVQSGDFIEAGQPVGYVGRTGRKAIKGKTHLHIAYYKINDGYPEPVDILKRLYKADPHPLKGSDRR